MTVLLSSHILSEVKRLCDRVTIIRRGVTIETGSLAQLRHLTRTQVSFSASSLGPLTVTAFQNRMPRAHDVALDAGRITFTTDRDRLPDVLPILATLRVEGLTVAPPSLEKLFLRHYRDDPAVRERPRTPSAPSAGCAHGVTGDTSPCGSPRWPCSYR